MLKRDSGFFFTDVFRNAAREKAKFGILLHREPREQSEALKHHGDLGIGSYERCANHQDAPVTGLNQAGENA